MADEGQRRLATIIAADIVGYSRMMSLDEAGTLARMKEHRRELIDPTIADHEGRIVKGTGDGFIAEFGSPVEAVRAAIVIQQGMARRNATIDPAEQIVFRIGVNLGDIIVEPDDVFGDAVNVAARLENICEPGAVYISGVVYEIVKHKLVVGYHALGEQRLKNITDPVRVYRVLADPMAVADIRHKLQQPWLWFGGGVAVAAVVVAAVVISLAWRAPAPSVQAAAGGSPSVRTAQTAATPNPVAPNARAIARWEQIRPGVRVFPSTGGYLEVTKVGTDHFVTTTDAGRQFVRFGGFIVFAQERVDAYKFDHAAAMTLWPLAAGNKVEVVVANSDESSRWMRTIEVKAADVVRIGEETYDALLVEVSIVGLTHRFNGIYRYWFAPKVGMFVKYECLLDPDCFRPWTAKAATFPAAH